ncbi:MAG: hypothetical protein WD648_06245 [Planctomycetaceae bacterium]
MTRSFRIACCVLALAGCQQPDAGRAALEKRVADLERELAALKAAAPAAVAGANNRLLIKDPESGCSAILGFHAGRKGRDTGVGLFVLDKEGEARACLFIDQKETARFRLPKPAQTKDGMISTASIHAEVWKKGSSGFFSSSIETDGLFATDVVVDKGLAAKRKGLHID